MQYTGQGNGIPRLTRQQLESFSTGGAEKGTSTSQFHKLGQGGYAFSLTES